MAYDKDNKTPTWQRSQARARASAQSAIDWIEDYKKRDMIDGADSLYHASIQLTTAREQHARALSQRNRALQRAILKAKP